MVEFLFWLVMSVALIIGLEIYEDWEKQGKGKK